MSSGVEETATPENNELSSFTEGSERGLVRRKSSVIFEKTDNVIKLKEGRLRRKSRVDLTAKAHFLLYIMEGKHIPNNKDVKAYVSAVVDDDSKNEFKSQHAKGGDLHPKWFERAVLALHGHDIHSAKLHFRLWDHNTIRGDKVLGYVSVSGLDLIDRLPKEGWYPIFNERQEGQPLKDTEVGGGGVGAGTGPGLTVTQAYRGPMVRLQLQYVDPLLPEPEVIESDLSPGPALVRYEMSLDEHGKIVHYETAGVRDVGGTIRDMERLSPQKPKPAPDSSEGLIARAATSPMRSELHGFGTGSWGGDGSGGGFYLNDGKGPGEADAGATSAQDILGRSAPTTGGSQNTAGYLTPTPDDPRATHPPARVQQLESMMDSMSQQNAELHAQTAKNARQMKELMDQNRMIMMEDYAHSGVDSSKWESFDAAESARAALTQQSRFETTRLPTSPRSPTRATEGEPGLEGFIKNLELRAQSMANENQKLLEQQNEQVRKLQKLQMDNMNLRKGIGSTLSGDPSRSNPFPNTTGIIESGTDTRPLRFGDAIAASHPAARGNEFADLPRGQRTASPYKPPRVEDDVPSADVSMDINDIMARIERMKTARAGDVIYTSGLDGMSRKIQSLAASTQTLQKQNQAIAHEKGATDSQMYSLAVQNASLMEGRPEDGLSQPMTRDAMNVPEWSRKMQYDAHPVLKPGSRPAPVSQLTAMDLGVPAASDDRFEQILQNSTVIPGHTQSMHARMSYPSRTPDAGPPVDGYAISNGALGQSALSIGSQPHAASGGSYVFAPKSTPATLSGTPVQGVPDAMFLEESEQYWRGRFPYKNTFIVTKTPGPGDFHTLREAIRACGESGDCVMVGPGHYYEGLLEIVNKDIQIYSTGRLDDAGQSTVIYGNFNILCSEGGMSNIKVVGSVCVQTTGPLEHRAAHPEIKYLIENCELAGNTPERSAPHDPMPVLWSPGSSFGLEVKWSSIRDCDTGVYMYERPSVVRIEECEFTNCKTAVAIANGGRGNLIKRCTFRQCERGVKVGKGYVVAEENTMVGVRFAIEVEGGMGEVRFNRIESGDVGICGTANLVEGNDIAAVSAVGLIVEPSPFDKTIRRNKIRENNGIGLKVDACGNANTMIEENEVVNQDVSQVALRLDKGVLDCVLRRNIIQSGYAARGIEMLCDGDCGLRINGRQRVPRAADTRTGLVIEDNLILERHKQTF